MSHTIKLSDDGAYIVVKIKGAITRQSAMKYAVEAHAFGKAHGVNRYLFDVTKARNIETVIGNYRLAYEDVANSSNIDKQARAVLLVSPDDHSHDFSETVHRNAGANVTLFRDRDQAVQYLMQGE